MPERDGYIAGVPCWVDASEPDPEAAVGFYGGLFGWEFEDVMPPGSEEQVLHRPVRGGGLVPVRHVRRIARRRCRRRRIDPRGSAAEGGVEHLLLGRQRRRGRDQGPRCRRRRRDGAL